MQSGDALGASYRIKTRIGAGAAGDVWLVDSLAGGELAAKILKPEHAHDPAIVERFVRERSVLIGLRHHNIVAVKDLVVEGETLAIVMDYVQGGSLGDLLSAQGPLPAAEALALCAQVFEGLATAHSKGIVHRDIKPDNVLLAEPWESGQTTTVRVADFGISSVVGERHRQTTGMLGTPHYMSPELISNGRSTSASDVYSTGILLYELLSGRTPFAGPGTDFTIAYRHVTAVVPALELPEPVWKFVDTLLAKDPRERPTASDAADHARRLAGQFASLPALTRASDAPEFTEVQRPATVMRGELLGGVPPALEVESALPHEAPDLGESGGRTVLKPMAMGIAPAAVPEPESKPAKKGRMPAWLTKRVALISGGGVLLAAGIVVAVILLTPDSKPEPVEPTETFATAQQQDLALPTGLMVSRTAQYDPVAKSVILEISYAAQKTALSGAILEVLPGAGDSVGCPVVRWDGVTAAKQQGSVTGIDAACGWRLDIGEIPTNGQVTARATLPLDLPEQADLNQWLSGAAQATVEAVSDSNVKSAAYPVQRLRDVQVVVPSRTVSQTPLAITLVPVWPSGPDELNPLYQSPSSGAPTQMLKDVAAGEDGVRFSDNCGGSVAVSSDGLVVTTLSMTPACTIYASVGNFTNLQSRPFSIASRE